ncbi:MAG: hypothetical protein HOV97_05600 [Nonomuraea sp.]|nr:hypothetical protein [Nonomuraea sp.]
MTETVHEQAQALRDYATHFAPRDWQWTREHGIHALYTEPLSARLLDSIKWAWRDGVARIRRKRGPLDEVLKVSWWRMRKAHWRGVNRLPDGGFEGASVFAHWEEDGEYIQMVQPKVGALIADLMDAHPDLPEVQAVAAEMKRIADDYTRRIEKEN